jgi:hypothetical protein
VILFGLLKNGQIQVELCEIPFTGAPENLRVASRRIGSDSCHADELMSRPEAYVEVRRNKPAPCSIRGRMREIPRSARQMGIFQQSALIISTDL